MARQKNERLRDIRMLYSVRDLQLALSAADFLTECDPDRKISKIELRRFRSYETMMVVAYARPFSQTKGDVPSLSLKMAGAKLTAEQMALHERMIELRNRAVAHSDGDMMRMVTKPHDIDLGDGKSFTFVEMVFDEGLEFIGDAAYRAIDLIRAVLFSLNHRLIAAAQERPADFDLRHDHLHQGG